MELNEIRTIFTTQLTSSLKVSSNNGSYTVELPFKDHLGDQIELLVTPTEDGFIVDDLGHTSSLLFHLGQHREGTPGHLLTRNLSDAYALNMDYDEGLLSIKINQDSDKSRLLDYIKVIIADQIVVPEIKRRKRERRGGKRLDVRIRKEIQPLSFSEYVQRQQEVAGRYEVWTVDYKYLCHTFRNPEDVLLVVADLRGREPRLKAEHVITLANDILDVGEKRHLRIIYDANGNSTQEAAQRAAAMITAYREKVGYQVYDFSNTSHKQELASVTHQEISALAMEKV
jgi:hypothetical protein